MVKSLTCRFTNPGQLLLYRWQQQHGVGFTCRQAEHTATRAANENRRMRLLYWPGNRMQVSYCVVLACERDGFATEELLHDGECLGEASIADACLVKGDAELLEIRWVGAKAHANLNPTIGELVQRGYL